MLLDYSALFYYMAVIYAMIGYSFSQGNGFENAPHRCTMFSPICTAIYTPGPSNFQPMPPRPLNIDSRNWEYPEPQKPLAENRPYNSAIDENAKIPNTDQNYKSGTRFVPNFPRGPQFYPYFPSGSRNVPKSVGRIDQTNENGSMIENDKNYPSENLKNMNETVKTEMNETAAAEGDANQMSGKVSNMNQNLTHYSKNMSNWSGNLTRWSNNYSKSVRVNSHNSQPSGDPVGESNKMMAAGKKDFEKGVEEIKVSESTTPVIPTITHSPLYIRRMRLQKMHEEQKNNPNWKHTLPPKKLHV